MKNIIISNNKLLEPLYNNLNKKEFNIEILSELKCIQEIKNNNFDLALISPLVYTSVLGINDFRIIPANMLILEDYTNSLTINIKQNRQFLQKIYFSEINEFMIIATKLVLLERFNISPELTINIEEADIIVNNEKDIITDCFDIDLTEDWYDTFEVPLVTGFWIVNNENTEVIKDAIKLVNNFSNILQKEEVITKDYNETYLRIGKKYWTWNDNFRQYFEKIFDILYYNGYSEHIADVKLLNETYSNFNEII